MNASPGQGGLLANGRTRLPRSASCQPGRGRRSTAAIRTSPRLGCCCRPRFSEAAVRVRRTSAAQLPGDHARPRSRPPFGAPAPVRWPNPPERHGCVRDVLRRDRPARAAGCSACIAIGEGFPRRSGRHASWPAGGAEGSLCPGSSEAQDGSPASRRGGGRGGTAAGAWPQTTDRT